MSVDERLTAALMPLGLDIENSVSFSHEHRYIAFNYETVPATFADDAPNLEKYLVQVHLFTPLNENINKLKRGIKRALFNGGFTWPSTQDASDENGRHVVFECEDVEPIEVEDGKV